MKLVIVTVVEEFQKDALKLFKTSEIKNFSSTGISGFKNIETLMLKSNWFGNEKSGNDSSLIFSFTDDNHIEVLFEKIKKFNSDLQTNNPIKAVVLKKEKYI